MGKPLRVLYLIDAMRMGGAERITAALFPYLDRQRVTPILCTLHRRRESDLINTIGDVEHIDLASKRLVDPAAIKRLIDLIQERNIDVIHAQLQDATVFAALARVFTHTPIVITRHLMEDDRKNIRRRLRNRVERFTISSSVARVISVSDAALEAYVQKLQISRERFVTVYNGIDIERFKPNADKSDMRKKLNLPDDKPLIAMVGVMRGAKGHDVAIEAARQVTNAHFLLVGDGAQRPQYEQQAQGLSNVHFLGQRMDVPEILSACDILILPSDMEALPTVLIEAGAAGLPCVASDVGGASEIVKDGETGFMIPPRNPDALAAALKRLLDDPAFAKAMGDKARAMVLERFTLSKQALELVELYARVVAEQATGGK
ncbi:MAG: glycosyltransferase family 4 protein [Anaerolineae bacterium]